MSRPQRHVLGGGAFIGGSDNGEILVLERGPERDPGLEGLLLCFLGGHLCGRPRWYDTFHARIGNGLSEMLVHVRQED